MIGVALQLSEYKSHKRVRAGRIVGVNPSYFIVKRADGGTCDVARDPVLDGRYTPKIGDYYIVHDDGYASITSEIDFIAGYSRVL